MATELITQGATTVRSIGYDAAGNITSDNRLGSTYAYTYNKANRLKTVSYEGNLKGTYTYNGLSQLITRVVTNSGTLDGTTHYVHDRSGNVIAELNAAGATVREYIWLPEAEIAPTAASRAQIDRPIAVVDGVDTATPATYYVHTDRSLLAGSIHARADRRAGDRSGHRPIRLSNAAKSFVWQAEYQPRAPIVEAPERSSRFGVNRQRNQSARGAVAVRRAHARPPLPRTVVPARSRLALFCHEVG